MQPEFESITPPILVLRDTEAIVAADRSVRAALRGQRLRARLNGAMRSLEIRQPRCKARAAPDPFRPDPRTAYIPLHPS
jgi:hypothetical protein